LFNWPIIPDITPGYVGFPKVSKEGSFGLAEARCNTVRMPLVLSNQQHQSTENNIYANTRKPHCTDINHSTQLFMKHCSSTNGTLWRQANHCITLQWPLLWHVCIFTILINFTYY